MRLIAYCVMVVYDLAILAGTAYLVEERHWSAWWFVLAMMIVGASSPEKVFSGERDAANG